MIVLYFLGYFYRNKQNSYAALIYILIVILFLVLIEVNFAAIFDFSIQIYTSVTFISGPLS